MGGKGTNFDQLMSVTIARPAKMHGFIRLLGEGASLVWVETPLIHLIPIIESSSDLGKLPSSVGQRSDISVVTTVGLFHLSL